MMNEERTVLAEVEAFVLEHLYTEGVYGNGDKYRTVNQDMLEILTQIGCSRVACVIEDYIHVDTNEEYKARIKREKAEKAEKATEEA